MNWRQRSTQTTSSLLVIGWMAGCAVHSTAAPPTAAPTEPAPSPASSPPTPIPTRAEGDAQQTPPAPPAEDPTKVPPDPEPAPGATGQLYTYPPPKPAFERGMTIVVFGDSFANSIGLGLKHLLHAEGVRVILQGQKSTFAPQWAGPEMGMANAVTIFNPDLVVIGLGGNELGISKPETRAKYIHQVVENAQGKPCVWVAPALWELGDRYGYLEMIRSNSAPCRYFDTQKRSPELPRGGDKIHPDVEGRRLWAESLVAWLATERDRTEPSTFALLPRPEGE